jgi:hypothetical protein
MTTGFRAGRVGYYGPQGENGREWFEVVPHTQGSTVRAFCEMDELDLTRDVTMSLDTEGRPRDAFVRIIRGGQTLGSSLFIVDDQEIRCEAVTAELGHVSQRRPLSAPLSYLGLHPLVCDGLIALSRGTDRPGEFVAVDIITNSSSPSGEQGLIAFPGVIDVAYLGDEIITVPAGQFDAQRYALRWQPDWSPADLWVHGPSALFLRLAWDMIDSHYELVELRTSS